MEIVSLIIVWAVLVLVYAYLAVWVAVVLGYLVIPVLMGIAMIGKDDPWTANLSKD